MDGYYCDRMRTLQDLPLEILDMILMKAVVKLVRTTWEPSGYTVKVSAYEHLNTVWSEWHNRLTSRWFQLVLKRTLDHFNPRTKYLSKPELIEDIDVSHAVWGVALLNDELFIISLYSNCLFVYNNLNFTQQRVVAVDGLENCRDIVSCQKNKCLYLICCPSSLKRVDVNGKVLAQWSIDFDPCNLSVTSAGTVVLTCNPAGIFEYRSDGTLLRNLSLDQHEMAMMWQAISLDSGQFLVCQGWDQSRYHRVLKLQCSVTTGGGPVVACSFGDENNHISGRLHDPVYTTVDRDGCVLVADSGNDKIVLLSPNLYFLTDLLTGDDGLDQPYRVAVDEATGRLYVGMNSGHLLIFKIY